MVAEADVSAVARERERERLCVSSLVSESEPPLDLSRVGLTDSVTEADDVIRKDDVRVVSCDIVGLSEIESVADASGPDKLLDRVDKTDSLRDFSDDNVFETEGSVVVDSERVQRLSEADAEADLLPISDLVTESVSDMFSVDVIDASFDRVVDQLGSLLSVGDMVMFWVFVLFPFASANTTIR